MYPYPGYGATVLQKSQKFRVRVWGSSGLTKVPGMGTEELQNSQKFRVLWRGRTELTEIPGRYKNAKAVPRVFVARAYRTYSSSGYGYECPTELTEVLCRVMPGVNTRDIVR